MNKPAHYFSADPSKPPTAAVPTPRGDGTAIPRLLTPAEVARPLNLSVSWLAKARMRGDGPPYVKIGRAVRYSGADVQEWVKAQGRTSTSEREAADQRTPRDHRKRNYRP